MTIETRTFKVPGANLYAESRGQGPLLVMIPGGPADAGVFDGVASALADRYQVVAYDPRGNSRSQFDGEPQPFDINVMGDDAALLIREFGAPPAFVFGNSGGAQIALNLTARYPHLVKSLVAHEPPCIKLLAGPSEMSSLMTEVTREYREHGAKAALAIFNRLTSAMTPPRIATPPPPDVVATGQRIRGNLDYFFGFAARPIADYRPDLEKLRADRSRISVGYGRDSRGELAHQTALALAELLPAPAVAFPGGHGGFGPFASEFAALLHQAFSA